MRSAFADLIERTLHNVIATSPAPDGRHFFYANPLHQRVPGTVPAEDVESKRASSSLRAPWFLVACCPTNVARTLASLAAYLATADDGGIQIHQYARAASARRSTAAAPSASRRRPTYPDDGTVTVRITETDGAAVGAVAADPAVGVRRRARGTRRAGGGRRPAPPSSSEPFAVGDEVTLTLPMAPRWTAPDPRIDAVRGCVAVERGPTRAVRRVRRPPGRPPRRPCSVDPSVPPATRDGSVVVSATLIDPPERDWPYGDDAGASGGSTPTSMCR